MRLLAPLCDRLQRAGIAVLIDAGLASETLRFGADVVALTDGRTLAARRFERGADAPAVLLDLARDYATTTVLGAAGPAAALASLAALLKPAGIDLIALTDVAGLVVMREIACIVNEAADLITWTGTTAADIDTSMRLGMAYTQGPLAWADAIGAARVAGVLTHLQHHYGDARYRRAPRLSAVHFARENFHG